MKKVAVAMSGGVDSAVAALLLKESGHDVVGVTMCLGMAPAEGGRLKCCGPQEIEDARSVCRALGIRHYVVDFAADLEEKVIRPFVEEYGRGRTPNPCVACNRWIKFGSLLEKAMAWGFDGFATGHYAAIEENNGRYRLKIPKDRRKDQTYFLHAVPKEVLAKVLFPLAGYAKDEVRGIAQRAGLPLFDKPESQDICFIPAEGHRRLSPEPGGRDRTGRDRRSSGASDRTARGDRLLHHRSADRSRDRFADAPVCDGDRRRAKPPGRGEKRELLSEGLAAGQVNCLVDAFPEEAWAKIRYAHRAARCRISQKGGRLTVRFAEPQEAVSPGQSVVLYDDGTVLGGGIIQEVFIGTR